jgi:hypothetical protein
MDAGVGDPGQAALPADRQRRVIMLEHGFTAGRAYRLDLRSKKSCSTVNCPIFACSFSTSRFHACSASMPTPGSNIGAALCSSCFFHA